MKTQIIPVYAVNLKTRTDRKQNLLFQFENKCEFNLKVVPAINKYKTGAFNLWKTIQHIIKTEIDRTQDFFIFCEDDHEFTGQYTQDLLLVCIKQAEILEADILSGGVSWFKSGIQISENLFWIDKFSGLQFVVIFKKFYNTILNTSFTYNDVADYKISSLTDKKFVIYPFISTQKEFGYSDITMNNNKLGSVAHLFSDSSKRFSLLIKFKDFYGFKSYSEEIEEYSDFIIPTYIINSSERTDRIKHIRQQFADKPEFEIEIIDVDKHDVGDMGLWNSIVKIINTAINSEDEVIIICKDDHSFTEHYNRDVLIKNILYAYDQGVDVLVGCIDSFSHAVAISPNMYWIDKYCRTQFIVIYSKFFNEILDAVYTEIITIDEFISSMTVNKMVLFPFISIHNEFNVSNRNLVNKQISSKVTRQINNADSKLKMYEKVYKKYLLD